MVLQNILISFLTTTKRAKTLSLLYSYKTLHLWSYISGMLNPIWYINLFLWISKHMNLSNLYLLHDCKGFNRYSKTYNCSWFILSNLERYIVIAQDVNFTPNEYFLYSIVIILQKVVIFSQYYSIFLWFQGFFLSLEMVLPLWSSVDFPS